MLAVVVSLICCGGSLALLDFLYEEFSVGGQEGEVYGISDGELLGLFGVFDFEDHGHGWHVVWDVLVGDGEAWRIYLLDNAFSLVASVWGLVLWPAGGKEEGEEEANDDALFVFHEFSKWVNRRAILRVVKSKARRIRKDMALAKRMAMSGSGRRAPSWGVAT